MESPALPQARVAEYRVRQSTRRSQAYVDPADWAGLADWRAHRGGDGHGCRMLRIAPGGRSSDARLWVPVNNGAMPRPIRVGFDDQIFQAQRRGGVSRFFVELIRHLPDQDVEPVLLSDGTRNLHLAESGMVPERPELSHFQQRMQWVSWSLLGHPRTMPRRLPPLDLLHHTYSHRSYLRMWRGPRVMSLYDMTPETYPELFPLGNPHFAKRRYTEVADRIISISE